MATNGTSLFDFAAEKAEGAGVRRVFLDWSQPLIRMAAEWLIENRARLSAGGGDGEEIRGGAGGGGLGFDNNCVDLRPVLCVLPGRRAGRLLLEELLRLCDESDRALLPPTMTTPGHAVDALLAATDVKDTKIIADAWTVELAWMEALRTADEEVLRPIASHLPERENIPAWMRMGRTLAGLHENLAGARCAFADVAPRAESMELFPEGDRWAALSAIYDRYVSILDRHRFVDPHVRREQLLGSFDGQSNHDMTTAAVLIGVVELNGFQRAAISAVAKLVHVTALVHGPEGMADRFDTFGCVREGAWNDVIVDDAKATIIVADRPMDQAQRVIETIASFEGKFAADEIIIGLGDANLSGAIDRSASWAGLKVHDAAGVPIARSPVFRLLKLCVQWLSRRRFADLAALVRHPHLERWLQSKLPAGRASKGIEHWATLLDDYYSKHLHGECDGNWLGTPEQQRALKAVHDGVETLLAPLRGDAKPLGEWAQSVTQVLNELYHDVMRRYEWAQAMRIREAVDQICAAAVQMERSSAALQPVVNGATALTLVLSSCESGAMAENIDEHAIEMLGWLELHADPAPALILTGFNEGAIPSSISADIFLPDRLRRCLGLPHSAMRYARDSYLTHVAQQCRESLTIITGRRAANDEPLTPSRLLLQGDDGLLVRRAELLCGESDADESPVPIGLTQPVKDTKFVVPSLPDDMPTIDYMRVTDFKLYLNCPYRFALIRYDLARLKDDSLELDPMRFGSMLHEVLNCFGRDEAMRALNDADKIESAVHEILREYVRSLFGARPTPSVRIQLAMLEQRLRGFAVAQARLRSDGWAIHHTEYDVRDVAALYIPGDAPMPLRGRIDRIDYNPQRNAWRLIDYKSSERPSTPTQSHHGDRKTVPKDEELAWSDLQLPLYDYIIRQTDLGIEGRVELCYFNLPRSSDECGVCEATWSPNHLAHALDTARQIVCAIRRGEFEPNRDAGGPYDEFARLLHNEFLSAMYDGEPEPGAGAEAEE